MTQNHTQGPWHRNIKPATKYNTIYAGRNTHVAHLETTGLDSEEVEANANLIAAAPELLDALNELKQWFSTIEGTLLVDCSKARAAIAKAEGNE